MSFSIHPPAYSYNNWAISSPVLARIFLYFFPAAASSATKSCPFSAPIINFDVESIGKYFGQLRSTRFALNSAHEKSGV